MNGLVQGTGPCTFRSIPGDSPSQGTFRVMSEGVLKESDVWDNSVVTP